MKLKNKGKKKSLPSLVLIPLFLLVACASKPPEILQTTWNIYVYQNRINNTRYEALSLFLNLNDPDGIDDIEKIYLINDNQELFWKLDDNNWIKKKIGTVTWIGSNKIVTINRKTFPRGTYRVTVYDFGGNSTEKSIFIDTPVINITRIVFPTVTVKGPIITLNEKRSRITGAEIWIYQDKKFITSYPFRNKKIDITRIAKNKSFLVNGFEFELYSYNPKYNIYLLTGPFYSERIETKESFKKLEK